MEDIARKHYSNLTANARRYCGKMGEAEISRYIRHRNTLIFYLLDPVLIYVPFLDAFYLEIPV